jgi:hypothetical protein
MNGPPMNADERRLIDGGEFPTADDDYTPEQRRLIDALLAESDDDIKCGRVYGPFETHGRFMTSLRREAARHRRKKET